MGFIVFVSSALYCEPWTRLGEIASIKARFLWSGPIASADCSLPRQRQEDAAWKESVGRISGRRVRLARGPAATGSIRELKDPNLYQLRNREILQTASFHVPDEIWRDFEDANLNQLVEGGLIS